MNTERDDINKRYSTEDIRDSQLVRSMRINLEDHWRCFWAPPEEQIPGLPLSIHRTMPFIDYIDLIITASGDVIKNDGDNPDEDFGYMALLAIRRDYLADQDVAP